ncbi:MAG: hypothetical protein J5857_04680 [Treponema sp.]|nr:hypothetical protein [Treponema sp.]
MDEIIKKKIEFEISQLDEHLSKSSVLVKKCAVQEPDYVELCAAGSILQSFYNGIENILLVITKNIDGIIPKQGKWHSELLSSMFKPVEKRSAVFSESLYPILTEYMNFRHFFRHSYGYSMKWEKLSHLFINIDRNWGIIKKELIDFISR